jgi:acyl-CoA synthetase (AMP-forming)/AMP-acid ligase II
MAEPDKITRQMTLGEALDHAAARYSQRVAMIEAGVQITYHQLLSHVRRLARLMRSLGVKKGDRVALLLWSSSDFIISFFATAEIGAVAAPLPPRMRREQMLAYLRHLEPSLVIVSSAIEIPGGLEALGNLKDELESIREVLITNEPPGGGLVVEAAEDGVPERPVVEGGMASTDLVTILYTSGTTGEAKGVMHSHRGLISPVVASMKLREMWLSFFPTLGRLRRWVRVLLRYGARLVRAAGRQQRFLSTMSMHTISGLEAMLQAVLMGDRLILHPKFHPVRSLETIERERVTVLIGVPLSYMMMLRVKDFEKYKLSSLLICATGAAPCPPGLAREIQRRFGCAVHVGFGMTELGGGIAATMLEDSPKLQAETVGKAMPGMDVIVVDEHKHPLPRGEVGELACRTDSMMMGYFGEDGVSPSESDGDGYYYTGDLAVIDEDGYIRIVGRKKDMIIRGGQNIHPARIESELGKMEEVQEAAIVGVPDGMGVERVCAFVILEEGRILTEKEIVSQCRKNLEAYEIPERIWFVADYPCTQTGKPQKFKLRQIALEKVTK